MKNFLFKLLILVFLGYVNEVFCIDTNGLTIEQRFTTIYDTARWGKYEGKAYSGPGSDPKNCIAYMEFLQNFLQEKNISSVVDFGCGDWTFSRYIDWGDIHYIGVDVVKSVVDENIKKYGSSSRCFIHSNGLDMDLPAADLLICKDVLQHLSNKSIFAFLKQCSKFKYCLIANDVCSRKKILNSDVNDGGYRILDLTQYPFELAAEKVLTYERKFDGVKTQLLLVSNQSSQKKNQKVKVVNLLAARHFIGGIHTHLLGFNKLFADHGIDAEILTNGKYMIEATHALGNPYGLPSVGYNHEDLLARPDDIVHCDPKIVICNWLQEVENALKAKERASFKIIYVHHDPANEKLPKNIKKLSQCDGVVVVDSRNVSLIKDLCKKQSLKIPVVAHMPPFVEAEKFLNFSPNFSKKDYFKQEHAIDIADDFPIITMIANMNGYKNHQLLFKALDILCNQRKKKVHAILAGSGPLVEEHKITVKKLNLNENVHFLGQVLTTPELLYHSDIHVLASKKEGFPIVQMEAGFMKKPFIGSDATSVITYIQQGVNGFTFKDNNAEDLANKLEYLLDNPNELKAMGENAYNYALENFSPAVIFAQWQDFLSRI